LDVLIGGCDRGLESAAKGVVRNEVAHRRPGSGTFIGRRDEIPHRRARLVGGVPSAAAGATRGVLAVLCDAYAEEEADADGKGQRTVLRLHPRLAPIKAGILPLVKKDGMPETARRIVDDFLKAGVNAKYDQQHAIGKRYARHDEVGTPYCLTVDGQTREDETVTIRYRDDRRQERIKVAEAVEVVQKALRD
ncbi:MAG: His/Gly/Thr/Pro-type tRNA ligase C-terminal domain-containing protein, partial [Acidobacteriota bacterium]